MILPSCNGSTLSRRQTKFEPELPTLSAHSLSVAFYDICLAISRSLQLLGEDTFNTSAIFRRGL